MIFNKFEGSRYHQIRERGGGGRKFKFSCHPRVFVRMRIRLFYHLLLYSDDIHKRLIVRTHLLAVPYYIDIPYLSALS